MKREPAAPARPPLETVDDALLRDAFKAADVKLNGRKRDGEWAVIMLVTPWSGDPDEVKVAGSFVSNRVERGDAIRLMKRLIQEFEAEQQR